MNAYLPNREPGFQVELDRAMAKGQVTSRAERDSFRDQYIAARRLRIAQQLEDLVAYLKSSGAQILALGKNSAYVVAEAPGYAIEAIADHPDVERVETADRPGNATSDGLVMQHGMQVKQFIDAGHDGELNPSYSTDDLSAALIEYNKEGTNSDDQSFRIDHNALRDSGATSPFRFAILNYSPYEGIWYCEQQSSCDLVTSYTEPPGNHATRGLGVILGDLTDGQISSYPSADRDRASGFAREARAHLYLMTGMTDAISAMDHILGLSSAESPPHIVSNAYKFNTTPVCEGDSNLARQANVLYQEGFAVIAGASNDGGSASQCKVFAPGDAIGSFTVGAHMSSGSSIVDVRTAAIYDSGGLVSAWGGNSTQGQTARSLASPLPGSEAT